MSCSRWAYAALKDWMRKKTEEQLNMQIDTKSITECNGEPRIAKDSIFRKPLHINIG